MKEIQKNLLDFLEHGDNIEEKFQNLKKIFDDINIHDNQFQIESLFYLIIRISSNHYREHDFFNKIEQILGLFKDDIKHYFSNDELFHIFRSNKRLLLFLLEENMMVMDEFIAQKIIKDNNNKYYKAKYLKYFKPEIQPFINEKWFPEYCRDGWMEYFKKELPSDFYLKRKIGENDDEICRLIQKDSIEEFIIYVNKNCYPVNSTINSSIYETNNYLLKDKDISLIEYAVFFGSIQIFNYLSKNGVEIKPTLWTYAVHGENPQIINFLEENKIFPSKFEEIFYETIKCHHIDAANYIQDNYLQNKKEYINDASINGLKYYNFISIQSDIDNYTLFYYSCKYNYYLLAFVLLQKIDIDINKKLIYNKIFNYIHNHII